MSKNDEDPPVRYEGNTIFFFCSVDDDSVRDLCILLKRLSLSNQHIKLCIRSDGGDVYAGFAGLDFMRGLIQQGTHIETIVYGYCASAATFLLLGGSKRTMGKNAFVLIHQMNQDAWGNYSYTELIDDLKNNKKIMKQFKKIYSEYTKLPDDFLGKLLKHDVNVSSKKCLLYEIVHEIF